MAANVATRSAEVALRRIYCSNGACWVIYKSQDTMLELRLKFYSQTVRWYAFVPGIH